jgi:hypothetical protein
LLLIAAETKRGKGRRKGGSPIRTKNDWVSPERAFFFLLHWSCRRAGERPLVGRVCVCVYVGALCESAQKKHTQQAAASKMRLRLSIAPLQWPVVYVSVYLLLLLQTPTCQASGGRWRPATTTTAARTFLNEASQRSGWLRSIPALAEQRSRSLRDTLDVVSVKTRVVKQLSKVTGSHTGFYYGMTPHLVQTHTTQRSGDRIKPLPMKDAVSLTLDELRSMRLDMEGLRDEIRALQRQLGGGSEVDQGSEDPDALLAQGRKRQREFDRIGREVERWAEHLLFEQEGEVDGWKEVNCNKVLEASYNKHGCTKAYLKWMKDSRGSHANPDDDREYPCLKVFTTIDAPLEIVCQYLSDEQKFQEYNDLVVKHKQVEEIAPHAQICWGQTPPILFIQPRDFITFCHHRWLSDGTQVVVNQACDNHPSFVPDRPQAFAIRGANFLSRDPSDPTKTRIALLSHASPGPDVPHWASKTAVKALLPIEPFKLFHKISEGIVQHRQELEEALPPAEMVSSTVNGRSCRPAGIAQMGYACFWPEGGGLQEEAPLEPSPNDLPSEDSSNEPIAVASHADNQSS